MVWRFANLEVLWLVWSSILKRDWWFGDLEIGSRTLRSRILTHSTAGGVGGFYVEN